MAKGIEYFSQLWLTGTDPRRYALVRIGFALMVLVEVVHLLPYSATLLSETGHLPSAPARDSAPGLYFPIFVLTPTPLLAALCLILAGAAAVLLAFGIYARVMVAFLLWFLVSIVHRIPLASTGWDMILCNFALLLLISPLATEWGPRRLAKQWKFKDPQPEVPRYGLVLMQLQVFVIYWQTALQKLLDPYWTSGDFMGYFLLSHHGRFPGTWVIEYGGMLEMVTHMVLAVELFVPLMLWFAGLRFWGLLIGISFHLGIVVLGVNLSMFSLVMLFTYLAFVNPWRPETEKGDEDEAD